jgi:2',3'-cyclic-nucleotide 2'-phosphodiesterase (5'-nucleotidase family)
MRFSGGHEKNVAMSRRLSLWRRIGGIGLVALYVAVGASCGKKGAEQKASAKPDELTVIFSSDLLGKIRSCGCVVKDMGGLGRRVTYTENVRASVENCIVVDAGDAFGAELSFTETEAELAFDAMNLMKLDAFTPGETDFVFGLPFLEELAGRSAFSIVAANIVDPATGGALFGTPYTVKRLKGGLRVGITGVLDDAIRFPAYIDASKFKVLPAAESLRKLIPELRRQADFLVLLSHMGLTRSMELAREIPDFDLIFIGHEKPVVKKIEKQGETILLASGGVGQYLGRLDLSLSGTGAVTQGEMHLVPMEDPLEIHEGVRDLFAKYGLDLTEKERSHKKK